MLHFLEEKEFMYPAVQPVPRGGASHVLASMGMDHQRADSAIRLSFGRYNTLEEVPAFFYRLCRKAWTGFENNSAIRN